MNAQAESKKTTLPRPPNLGPLRGPSPQGEGGLSYHCHYPCRYPHPYRARPLRFATLALFGLLLFAAATRAFAVEPSERLANPVLEARAEAIGSTLRCLVCQDESIEESNASLAHDIRVLLRQLLVKGDTNAQARSAIVARYGEFVLLDPPVQPATYVLWFGPVVLLLGGFAATVLWLRRRPATASPRPLSAQERRRLDSLLHEADR